MSTDLLFLRDAYQREFEARVIAVNDDGGTQVRSTAEVGRIVVTKTESKGKGNKRIRLRIEDG